MTAKMRARGRSLLSATPLFLLLPAFFVLNAYLVGQGHRIAYSSDLVHPYMLLQDFLRSLDTPWWWHHSPALYIYPDWLLALIVMAIPVPPLAWPLLFAPLILTLHSVAGGALLSVAGVARTIPAIWAMAAVIYAAGLACTVVPGRYAADAITAIASPYIHSGAALVALAGAALMLYRLTGRGGIWHDALLGAGVFAVAFSDSFFIAWFALPALILAVIYAWSMWLRRGLWIAAIVTGSAGAAFALETSIHGVWRIYTRSRGEGADSAELAWQLLVDVFRSDSVSASIVVAAFAMMGAAAIPVLRALRMRVPSPRAVLVIFLGGSAAGTLLAPIVLNIMPNANVARYFLMLGPLAAVGAASVLLCVGGCHVRHLRVAWIASAAVLAPSAALALPTLNAMPRVLAPPALETCLRKYARTTGIGDYWSAKSLMFATRRSIHVVQITPWMERFRWNYNERWFTHRADNDAPVRPDFVLPRGLDAHHLVHAYGAPWRIEKCVDAEIWLYDAPLAVPQ